MCPISQWLLYHVVIHAGGVQLSHLVAFHTWLAAVRRTFAGVPREWCSRQCFLFFSLALVKGLVLQRWTPAAWWWTLGLKILRTQPLLWIFLQAKNHSESGLTTQLWGFTHTHVHPELPVAAPRDCSGMSHEEEQRDCNGYSNKCSYNNTPSSPLPSLGMIYQNEKQNYCVCSANSYWQNL